MMHSKQSWAWFVVGWAVINVGYLWFLLSPYGVPQVVTVCLIGLGCMVYSLRAKKTGGDDE